MTPTSLRLAPVARLAPELLCRIFLNFRSDRLYGQFISCLGDSYTLNPSLCPTLFRILLVCRRWREVALACSRLWSHISIYNPSPPLLSFMVKYSRNSPLSLSGGIKVYSEEEEERIDTVMALLSRTYVLHLRLALTDRTKVTTALSRLLNAYSAPRLQSLDIWYGKPSTPNVPITVTTSSLPAHLSSLTLNRIAISMSPTFIHTSLTTLKIESLPSLWRCLLPGALLDTLENFPNLSSLTMNCGSNVPRARPIPRSQPAGLPRLQVFTLSGTPAHIAYILASLSLPPAVTLALRIIESSSYDTPDFPAGWVAPPNQLGNHVSDETINEIATLLFIELKQIVMSRCQSSKGKENRETYRVEYSFFHATDDQNLDIAIKPVDDRLSPFITVQYAETRDMSGNEETDTKEADTIMRQSALPFLARFSDILPVDVVRELQFITDVPEFPLINDLQWRPSFLDWDELQTVHVGGAGTAAWMAPYLTTTDHNLASVFPPLQVLILDKVNKSSSLEPQRIWSGQLHQRSTSIVDQWDRVIRARTACDGQKLKKLGLVEGGGRRLWRTWIKTATETAWMKGCDTKWRVDNRWTYESDEDMSDTELESDRGDGPDDGWIEEVDKEHRFHSLAWAFT